MFCLYWKDSLTPLPPCSSCSSKYSFEIMWNIPVIFGMNDYCIQNNNPNQERQASRSPNMMFYWFVHFYPSSHNHGSGRWDPSNICFLWFRAVFHFMIMGERIKLEILRETSAWQYLKPSEGLEYWLVSRSIFWTKHGIFCATCGMFHKSAKKKHHLDMLQQKPLVSRFDRLTNLNIYNLNWFLHQQSDFLKHQRRHSFLTSRLMALNIDLLEMDIGLVLTFLLEI